MSRASELAAILCVALLACGFTPAVLAQSSGVQGSAGTLHMKVSVVPNKMPADGGTYAAIFIQLATAKGEIVPAPESYQVFLTSANVLVATVQAVLVIQSGQTFGFATVTTTMQPGSTNVTLAATGLAPASVIVTTLAVDNAPARVVPFLAPPTLFADSSSSYFFFLQLQDINGTPAMAPSDLNVAVTSSDAAVISLPTFLTIPAGMSEAETSFTAGSINGSSTITVQQNGLVSESFLAKTSFFPLALTLVSCAGASVATGSDVRLNLTALSSGVPVSGANVTWSVDVPGDSFTSGTLTTDNSGAANSVLHVGAGGNTTVTATVSATGYGQKSVSLKLLAQTLTLAITLIPDSIAINASQPSGVTALVTSSGKPVSGAQVTWSSSIGSLNPPVSSTGASGTATSTFSSPTDGNATITAQASAPDYAPVTGTTAIAVGPVSSGVATGGGPLDFLGPSVFGVPSALILVVVLVIIAFVLVRRRRRAGGRAPAEAPAEEVTGEDEEE